MFLKTIENAFFQTVAKIQDKIENKEVFFKGKDN
jgi:hypothetical protein